MKNVDEIQKFKDEVSYNINAISSAEKFKEISLDWIKEAGKLNWSYNFRWMDRPAIQFPNDAWVMQEIIWDVKPDLIIECGVAHGGSIMYYASLLAMIDLADAASNSDVLDPTKPKRKVLGIDIDIRAHNRKEIIASPFINWIELKEGSSIDAETIKWVEEYSKNYQNIMVILDSNHTHDHVLGELNAYAKLVTKNSYCVVFDTIVEDMPAELSDNRPWGPGNSPKTAVKEFLLQTNEFIIDSKISDKLQITVAPDGFLKRSSCDA